MAQKVSLYICKNGSRKYELADPKTIYPLGTIFVLRYKRARHSACGVNCWFLFNLKNLPTRGHDLSRALPKGGHPNHSDDPVISIN